jgi:hypothetical protein
MFALALVGRAGCLPLERFSRLRTISDEMGQATVVETTIVVIALIGRRKAQPRALLLFLLGLWCRRPIELSLLGRPGYPSAW